jgi:deazaflavin-dependent oxidoreductase (nitroreductase family)
MDTMTPDSDSTGSPPPYGPRMTRMLPTMHRAFGLVNRTFAAPALRAGLGPLLATPGGGSILLLRTRGRRSGLVREAPLGYALHDGAIYVCAGFGRRTAWVANLGAEPAVEVVLPGACVRGIAEEVTDRAEYDLVLPELVRALGLVGRATVPDALAPGDGSMDRWFETMPLVRIRVTGMLGGPWDPGGKGWMAMAAADVVVVGLAIAAFRGVSRRRG